MELFFLKRLRAFLNDDWTIKWTGEYDRYPAIEYKCRGCKAHLLWIAEGPKGFKSVSPVAKCCANAVPYPVDDPAYEAHLRELPRWDNKREPVERFVDNWDKLPGEYPYEKSNPGTGVGKA
jgi:hypothetical protein